MIDAKPFKAIISIDGRFSRWSSLPSCQGPNDTRESLLEQTLDDLKANGAKSPRLVKWID